MKKTVIIIAVAVAAVVAGILGFTVISDLIQENKLEKELDAISEAVSGENIDIEAVYGMLDRTVTKNDYAEVEKAYKSYLKDSFDNSIRIAELLNDERITSILTAENYTADGKDFAETKKYITETKAELERCKTLYSEFFTEEKVKSYIDGKDLDKYYIDLYMNEYVGDIGNDGSADELDAMIAEITETLDRSEDVIDFLIENKDSWQISGESIAFRNDSLTAEYDRLISLIGQEK